MKTSATLIAILAAIPLVAAVPAPATEADAAPEALNKLFEVDGNDWLKAVKEEAARQEAAANETETGIQARQNGKFQVHAMFTDNLINLGDVDTFHNLWQRMYDVSNDRGGLSDTTSGALSRFCNPPGARATVEDRFILDGQWGAVNGVSGWTMRDAVIHSMWETANTIGRRNGYTVYNNCYGFTWQEGKPNDKNSACGPYSKVKCPENRECPYGMECKYLKWGTWLPSIIRINVYNPNGSLRADAYQARISSRATGKGGCSKVQEIAAALAGFIPVAGSYFAAGIKVQCVFQ